MNANAFVAEEVEFADRPDEFFADEISPSLVRFELDMDGQTIFFSFSETVDLTTLQTDDIILTSGNQQYQLTAGAVSDLYNDTTTITLTHTDANNIKKSRLLAHNATVSVGFESTMVEDMN